MQTWVQRNGPTYEVVIFLEEADRMLVGLDLPSDGVWIDRTDILACHAKGRGERRFRG